RALRDRGDDRREPARRQERIGGARALVGRGGRRHARVRGFLLHADPLAQRVARGVVAPARGGRSRAAPGGGRGGRGAGGCVARARGGAWTPAGRGRRGASGARAEPGVTRRSRTPATTLRASRSARRTLA